MGLTWAVAWGAVGIVPRWILGFNPDAPFPIIFGVLGFFAGLTFAGIVMLRGRRSRIDQIPLSRFAGWGAVGGLLLSGAFAKAASLGWGDVAVIAPTFALACAVCASASLALARRGETRELSNAQGDHLELKRMSPAPVTRDDPVQSAIPKTPETTPGHSRSE